MIIALLFIACTPAHSTKIQNDPAEKEPMLSRSQICSKYLDKAVECSPILESKTLNTKACNESNREAAKINNCLGVGSCKQFARCAGLRLIGDPPDESVAKNEPPKQEDPKMKMCTTTNNFITKCLTGSDRKEMKGLEDFDANCLIEENNFNAPWFVASLRCYMRMNDEDCAKYQTCYGTELMVEVKVVADRAKAENEYLKDEKGKAAEVSIEELIEIDRVMRKSKKYINMRILFCNNAMSYLESCEKYKAAKMKENMKRSVIISKCNKLDDDGLDGIFLWGELETMSNWNVCWKTTGGSCRQFSTCLEQRNE